MMYSPDMVTGGRVRLAEGGMADMSTGDTFDWKQSLWFGSSKVKLVCAPKKEGMREKNYLDLLFWDCLNADINIKKTKPFVNQFFR